ncbi:MAG: HAD-IC family P-type ATPase, partial [Clostridia bacterium]|nr:HAD-IC family P-type ATPase [Clostridia bacterium]
MESEQKESLIRIILGTVLGVAAIIVSHLFSLPVWALVLIYLPGYLVAGSGVLLGAAGSIIHGELFDERFLMSAATIGAFFIGEYPEAVFVMVLYLIGEMLGDTAVDKTRDSVGALAELIPDSVTVIRDGAEEQVPPESVNPGELIIVRPGERIALDGTAEEGTSSLDLSALTGESLPRDIAPGDSVYSGAINLSGVLKIRTTGRVSESTVSRILEMVEESSEHKSKSEGFVRRFSRIYTPCVVAAAVIIGVVPPIFDGRWAVWIERALSFLVVSCPCAVVISVPLSFFCGIGNASRKGILFKGSVALETLSKADTAVFDKTGTLTDSGFVIEDVIPEDVSVSPEGLIGIAAYLESYSTHPLAAPVIEKYGRDIDKSRVSGVT